MNVAKHAICDPSEGYNKDTQCTGLTPDALPEVAEGLSDGSSHIGVSTRNVPHNNVHSTPKIDETARWYVLRTTYGREQKAHDYLSSHGVTVFNPTITTYQIIDGVKQVIKASRIPNILFAHGTLTEIKHYVYDNVNLPYLRFYYKESRMGNRVKREPLIVPDHQMESLRIICAAEADDIIMAVADDSKFKTGQVVRVLEGNFRGVIGRVARYQGQQRVAVIIDGFTTIATAYIPKGYLAKVEAI